jgi:hypothetical protein
MDSWAVLLKEWLRQDSKLAELKSKPDLLPFTGFPTSSGCSTECLLKTVKQSSICSRLLGYNREHTPFLMPIHV